MLLSCTSRRISIAKNTTIAGLLVAAGLLASVQAVQAQSDFWANVSFSTGVDYSSGDYGAAADTNILFVPFTGEVKTESFRFRVTVPWIRIEGPGGVVGGSDGGVVIGGGGAVTTNSGLGDVIASATYMVPPLGGIWPFIEVTGKVKFPTAKRSKALGTGEFDYTVQADIFQSLGRITPFVTVGYRFRGDPPMLNLRNGMLVSAGAAYSIRQGISAGLIFDYREASTATSEDPKEFVPYVTWKPADDWSINAYGVIGASDGSPDGGGGLQVKVTL